MVFLFVVCLRSVCRFYSTRLIVVVPEVPKGSLLSKTNKRIRNNVLVHFKGGVHSSHKEHFIEPFNGQRSFVKPDRRSDGCFIVPLEQEQCPYITGTRNSISCHCTCEILDFNQRSRISLKLVVSASILTKLFSDAIQENLTWVTIWSGNQAPWESQYENFYHIMSYNSV